MVMDYEAELKNLLNKIRKECAFNALAVRALDPVGYIPYAAHQGLSPDFVDDECFLGLKDDCICARIIRREVPKGSSLFTETGSFWCNFLCDKTVNELERLGMSPRGRCLQEGYKTLLVVPISNCNGNIGSLWMASHKENLLTEEKVSWFEDTAVKQAQKAVKKMSDCDKYNLFARFIASTGNSNDRENLTNYFKHLTHCPACRELSDCDLQFDRLIQESLLFIEPAPSELHSNIMQQITS